LKAVEKGVLPPIEPSQEKTLLETLSQAMAARRIDMKEEAEEEEDEWSDDDW
jgi:hypothetical protein